VLGPGTQVINGQRFDLPQASAYQPVAFGPTTQGVPQVSPTQPAFIGGAGGGGSSSAYGSVMGYGTADNNGTVAQVAANHPFNWKASPTLWVIVGLLTSVFLIGKIHWRKTILEANEGLKFAGASEEARVAA
jgi:hypothetical protein